MTNQRFIELSISSMLYREYTKSDSSSAVIVSIYIGTGKFIAEFTIFFQHPFQVSQLICNTSSIILAHLRCCLTYTYMR